MRRALSRVDVLGACACCGVLVVAAFASTERNRRQSQTAVCAEHLHAILQLMDSYLQGSNGIFPPSVVYPVDSTGTWGVNQQAIGAVHGVAHWSWLISQDTLARDETFACPAMKNGGAPRTNPGNDPANWERDQVNWRSESMMEGFAGHEYVDKQAPRIAYTGNAAILPRNGFTTSFTSGPRVNALVPQSSIAYPSRTILVAEFLDNWKALGLGETGGGSSRIYCKSHRPVNVFWHQAGGYNEYASPNNTAGFLYGTWADQVTYGIGRTADVRNRTNILDYTSGIPQINAVGRHHPGGDEHFEGSANFLLIDGSLRNTTPWRTMDERLWGDRYYGISGANQVLNY